MIAFNFEDIPLRSFGTNDSIPSLLGNSDIVAILQRQQQVMLQQFIEGQKAFELRQIQLEEKLTTLQSEIDKLSSSTTLSSSSSDGKTKRVVTCTLSVRLLKLRCSIVKNHFFQNKVYYIHKKLENQFKESEG